MPADDPDASEFTNDGFATLHRKLARAGSLKASVVGRDANWKFNLSNGRNESLLGLNSVVSFAHGLNRAMRMHNKVDRILVVTLIALGLIVSKGTADTKGEQLKAFREGRTVSLPPFMVMEDNTNKRIRPWVYLSAPGIEILSKCDENTTLWFAEQYIKRLKELEEVLPPRLQFEHSVRTTLILITPEMEKTMSSEVVRIMESRRSQEQHSYITASGRVTSFYAMIPQVDLSDSESTTTMLEQADNDRRAISLTNDYVLFALQRRRPPLPYWFQSIIFSLYQQIRWSDRQTLSIPSVYWPLVKDQATLDREKREKEIDDATVGATVLGRKRDRTPPTFVPAPLLSMQEFIAGPSARTGQASANQLDLWHYQGSLFLYWVFADETHERRKALWDFVDRSSREPATEALFRQCFGIGFADMTKELSDYLPQAENGPLSFLRVDSITTPDLRVIDADPIVCSRIQGDFVVKEMRGMAKSALAPYIQMYAARAEAILVRPYKAGSRNPDLLSVLGLYYADTGKDEDARPLLEQAVSARVVRPSIYITLAQIHYKDALAQPTGKDGKFGRNQAEAILGLLKKSTGFDPPQVETYQLAIAIWSHAEGYPSSEDIGFLEQGEEFFPNDSELRAGVESFREKPVER